MKGGHSKMKEYEDIFDEEFDMWQEEERQRQEDYFDERADELYEQYISDYYQKLDDDKQFVLIYNTASIREYIIPGTNIHKTEHLENGKIKTTSYWKRGEIKKEEN